MSFDKKERSFNKELSRARVKIENAFGIMNGRFRILKTVLSDNLDIIGDILMCCAILHNICLDHQDLWPEIDHYDSDGGIPADSNIDGETLRDYLKNYIYEE